MDTRYIIEELNNLNPWWDQGFSVEEESWPKRQEYEQLKKLINLKQIVSLVGLRRVGKSTLLKQLISFLIKEKKVKPENICYFLFDDTGQSQTGIIRDVINTYLHNKLGKNLNDISDKVYIFLDEVHFVNDWQVELKRFYDTSHQLKFIISGSSSLFVQKSAKESLAGRIMEQYISLLAFSDFLKIYNHKAKFSFKRIDLSNLDKIQQAQFDLTAQAKIFDSFYQKYLLQGQFPEIINWQDSNLIHKYLRSSVIKKIIEYDIPKIFDIDKLPELNTIFQIITKETGNLIEYQNIAAETGISKITVAKYIDILKQTFLANEVTNYQKSARVSPAVLKKIYTASTNFTCSLFGLSSASLAFNSLAGHLVETQVLSQLIPLNEKINLWHRRGIEVDFLVNINGHQLPIEVKYKNNIYDKDFKSLVKSMNELKLKTGLMLTRYDTGIKKIGNKNIYLAPVWAI